jgi:hypothetical protein
VRGITEGLAAIDADALAFINAAGITDATQIGAVNGLVLNLKAYGLWTKMKAIYPFVGGTANSHKYNLKDPQDTNAAFRLVFFGGWTHSANGALPNGTNAYTDTFLTPLTSLTINNSHLSFYSRTNNTVNGVSIGSFNTTFTSANQMIIKNTSGNFIGAIDSGNFTIANPYDSLGHYILSRTANNIIKGYRNNVLFASNNALSVTLNNRSIMIGARNENTPALFDNKQCAFASIGDGLTDSEAANFYTAVQNYNTILNRQV